MKTIQTLIEIPAKFKWSAQDERGVRMGYTVKPKINEPWDEWEPVGASECIELGRANPNPDWKNTLTRISEYEEVS